MKGQVVAITVVVATKTDDITMSTLLDVASLCSECRSRKRKNTLNAAGIASLQYVSAEFNI
jgi:hypothetical protein